MLYFLILVRTVNKRDTNLRRHLFCPENTKPVFVLFCFMIFLLYTQKVQIKLQTLGFLSQMWIFLVCPSATTLKAQLNFIVTHA